MSVEKHLVGWESRESGALVTALDGEAPEGVGEETHILHDPLPAGFLDGSLDWDAAARAFTAFAPKRLLTFNEWADRFTAEEQVAIAAAAMTDARVKLLYDRAIAASGAIDPADPRVAAGVQLFLALGLIGEESAARVLLP